MPPVDDDGLTLGEEATDTAPFISEAGDADDRAVELVQIGALVALSTQIVALLEQLVELTAHFKQQRAEHKRNVGKSPT